jgi:predicted nucleic acid-binding Zn ribbon protein
MKSDPELTPEELEFIRELRRRKCVVCGRRFTLSSDDQKYCSRACKDKAREERYGRTVVAF